MRIRTGDVDAPAEHALLEAYFAYRAASFPSIDRAYSVVFPSRAVFTHPAGVFLVVEDDSGSAVGCGGIRMLPSLAEGVVRVEVKHVWLSPEARGRGWAGTLMEALEAEARALGATELVLDTHHTLEGAARLYARLGYEGIEAYNENVNATRWYRKAL
ncbi:MAG: GNAT family N-acetyltransferase [Herbiconiux sp.]|uniref:GNAT family N-acetyltransferase n=1 Tax=Herbiconiux sp. TaxID=1871186 RepID=UPI0012094BB6|nr:GNAT family N-acetyltransferase [Herbiconiux sp.]TAJ49686.1 MAG: GNAT family N-acetyltransferase [Herbiconiux sp.]